MTSKNDTPLRHNVHNDMFTMSESPDDTDGIINNADDEINDDYNMYRLMLKTVYNANYCIPRFEIIIIGVLMMLIAVIAIFESVLNQHDLVIELRANDIRTIGALLFFFLLDFFTGKLSEYIISRFIRKHHRHESFIKEYKNIHSRDFRKTIVSIAYDMHSEHADMLQPSFDIIKDMMAIIENMSNDTLDNANMRIIRKFKTFIKNMHENNELDDNNMLVIANILARIIIPADTIDRTKAIILLHDMYSKK